MAPIHIIQMQKAQKANALKGSNYKKSGNKSLLQKNNNTARKCISVTMYVGDL